LRRENGILTATATLCLSAVFVLSVVLLSYQSSRALHRALLERAFQQEPAHARPDLDGLRRLGLAEEVAHAVGFLASPRAAYITGTTLHINGGMYMI